MEVVGKACKALAVTLLISVAALSMYVLMFSGGGEAPTQTVEIHELGYVDSVNVTILIDNNPGGPLKSPWGLSLYIETCNLTMLFDAGPDPEALKLNSEALKTNLTGLDVVVLSHEHVDHVLGLSYIARLNRNVTVYVPKHMSGSCKAWIRSLGLNMAEIETTTVISRGIAVIGELYGPPHEQALAINVKGLGLIVFVGCSHPGVDKIVAKAKDELNCEVYGVIGGFHLSGASLEKMRDVASNLIKMGLKKVYPIHCSGGNFRRFLRENYPQVYGDGHVGLKLSFKGEIVVDWKVPPPSLPTVFLSILAKVPVLRPGEMATATLHVAWKGVNDLEIASVEFRGDAAAGWISLAEELPKTFTKDPAEEEGGAGKDGEPPKARTRS